ncbi:phenylalanine--tRNA ligase subunit beta [Arenibacter sp. GZD96]|uniref:phenylalanine--tRNA ligase subunit beta n=1 Tax=Aurantibrevibacter litoralis TaxID=3106030 RepID=UPI002AFF0686|nr:phenylalanine--tRNA ligase subunit beta [Arenibacter sp. GZD-96]MEA1787374.1 phenylalanine--tRNA ligase subunit beta [Arenibacter sp. GZD-96]
MKISYNWLKQFLKIDWEASRTAELLTDLGLEVESVTTFESVKGGLKGVVVGQVLSCEKHPNADKLKLTTVAIGRESPLQIVCGAPNVQQGQKVAVATAGTTLYMSNGTELTIKNGKIRGEESQGMLCAEDELGLGTNHEGIMVLSEDLPVGTPCASVFELENDEVFEIGLTPNRADAMSHFGVARDLRAGMKQKGIQKELITPPVSHFNVLNRSLKIDVDILNNDLAPRYCGLTLSNLIVQPSPDWLKNRLRAIGITPKNNLVDATNYVMHELGQPLHAFDAGKIKGGKILVKTLPEGSPFVTLDGVERKLSSEDLMICDAEKPLCIAGVFGGMNSGITETTTSIFLESAYFNPIAIRKTAKRHGLATDASFRFERGVDIENVDYSLRRAALLIKEIAGGDITSDLVDVYPKKKEDYQVFLTFSKINKLIGQEIPTDTIKAILASLDIKIRNVSESGLGLSIPFYRVDVQREVDVIEEILRIYGYNNVASKEKLNASVAKTSKYEDYKVQNIVGNSLAAQGFFEILTNSFTAPKYGELFPEIYPEKPVALLNPLGLDLSVMRQTMLFSGLEAIKHNINRKKQHLKFFEFGKTYHNHTPDHNENKHLALFLTGNDSEENWVKSPEKIHFYTVKSLVEGVLRRLGLTQWQTAAAHVPIFSEGISLSSEGQTLVELGIVKRAFLAPFEIKQDVFFADFKWDLLLKRIAGTQILYKEIPKYPEVRRDLALLLQESVSYQEVEQLAFKTEKKLLKEMRLFDVYTGNNLPHGKKSYAVSFLLQDDNSTLTDKQIDKVMKKLQYSFETELHAELR